MTIARDAISAFSKSAANVAIRKASAVGVRFAGLEVIFLEKLNCNGSSCVHMGANE